MGQRAHEAHKPNKGLKVENQNPVTCGNGVFYLDRFE